MCSTTRDKHYSWRKTFMDQGVLDALTAIASLLAIAIALFTFIQQCRSSRRTAITQTITNERMEWIRQTRKALLYFEQSYRGFNITKMKDARAEFETLMRRDTPEYCYLLEHIDYCIRAKYSDSDYELLIGLSSYILARAWQRVKLDGEGILPRTNSQKNKYVTRQTSLLYAMAASGMYMRPLPVIANHLYQIKRKKDQERFQKLMQNRPTFLHP